MEIKVLYIVICDATVDRICFSIAKVFQYRGKNINVQWAVGGVTCCSDHDHLLRCGQTVAPRYRVPVYLSC